MTDETFDISRRKILAGMSAVGVAGATAGIGTSAYFSDDETFENNTLTAGELDLKVDWEEHYSDWSDDENQDITEPEPDGPDDDGSGTFDVLMEEPDDLEEYTPFPPGTNSADATPDPLIWVPKEYVDDFMRNTALEAFPDEDNDGTGEFPVESLLPNKKPCDLLADVGGADDDLGTYTDSSTGTLGRTDNDDTRLENGDPAPLINLTDVKPGDFGEVTFSTHLCDNPGYLWMQMPNGLDLSEGGLTEPEMEDPDEDQTINETTGNVTLKDGETPPAEVELADEVQTAIWYDNNCDNLVTGQEKIDVLAVVDTSASIDGRLDNSDTTEEIDQLVGAMNRFVDQLPKGTIDGEPRIRGGLMTFNGAVEDAIGGEPRVREQPALRKGLGALSQFDTDNNGDADIGGFMPVVGAGDSPLPHVLDLGEQVLLDQGRPDARKVMVLVSDGNPDYTNPISDDTPYTVTDPDSGASYTQSQEYNGASDDDSTCLELDESAVAANNAKGNGVDILGTGVELPPTECDPDGDGTPIGGDTFMINRIVGVMDSPNTAEPNYFFHPDDFATLEDLTDAIAQRLVGGQGTGDEVIFRGTLREAADVLSDGLGLPLDADRDTPYDELNDPADDPDREPFPAFMTHCFGFSWWLPVDHANEIQSDVAQFDIGFYTEQARHNTGMGMVQ